MAQEERRMVKLRVVAAMQSGLPWQEAARAADARLSRATAFRALRLVRAQGEEAMVDGRHGHPLQADTVSARVAGGVLSRYTRSSKQGGASRD